MVDKACRIASRLRELGIRPYGVVRIDSASVEDWAKDPVGNTAHRRDLPPGLRRRREPRRTAGGGGRNLLGRHAQLENDDRPAGSGRSAADAWLPGRYGPHAPLHPGLQRPRPASCRKTSTGTTASARPGADDAHRRAPAVDDRFPRRPERRHGLRLRLHDKTGRHCRSTTPTAGSISSSTPATGCAMRPAADARHQHICWDGCMFPNR